MKTKLTLAAIIFAALCCGSVPTLAQTTAPTLPEYQPFVDNPAIVARLQDLPAGNGAMLGKYVIEPENAADFHSRNKKGPQRRDYCNKMPYAPERGTALYCGANHGTPHRLSDVWEFHLGANTWRMVLAPGGDATRLASVNTRVQRLKKNITEGKEVETAKASLETALAERKQWYLDNAILREGYLQDPANHGPVEPWHTWDGLTYDHRQQRLYWAVLDTDNFKQDNNKAHRNLVKRYASSTDQNFEDLYSQIKPSSSMYWYSPASNRWFRQIGEAPFPVMRGMGGSLTYLPDRDRTLWYCAASNAPGGYDGVWLYDANANNWTNLISGDAIYNQVHKEKIAPEAEAQFVYAQPSGKLVAVLKDKTFIYDLAANKWSPASDNPSFGSDAHSAFVYDSNANACLLFGRKGGNYSKEPWTLSVYDIANDKWEVVDVQGDPLPQNETVAGYYDPAHNAFVIYCGRSAQTYVYRHKK